MIYLGSPRVGKKKKISGKDTDWSCLDHMSTSVPIIVAERMGTCNWLEMVHMFSLVAKA